MCAFYISVIVISCFILVKFFACATFAILLHHFMTAFQTLISITSLLLLDYCVLMALFDLSVFTLYLIVNLPVLVSPLQCLSSTSPTVSYCFSLYMHLNICLLLWSCIIFIFIFWKSCCFLLLSLQHFKVCPWNTVIGWLFIQSLGKCIFETPFTFRNSFQGQTFWVYSHPKSFNIHCG